MTNDELTPCWWVKDFADGWINFYDVDMAILEAKASGAIMRYSETGKYPERAALAPVDVDGLANYIRAINGDNTMGAGELAEKITDHLAARGFFGVWQPIETAPKDGTWIMVYWPTMGIGQYPFVVFWDEGWQPARYSDRDYGEAFPTHWMPLPAAPKKEGV